MFKKKKKCVKLIVMLFRYLFDHKNVNCIIHIKFPI